MATDKKQAAPAGATTAPRKKSPPDPNIDRQKLPLPGGRAVKMQAPKNLTPAEQKMVMAWLDVLFSTPPAPMVAPVKPLAPVNGGASRPDGWPAEPSA